MWYYILYARTCAVCRSNNNGGYIDDRGKIIVYDVMRRRRPRRSRPCFVFRISDIPIICYYGYRSVNIYLQLYKIIYIANEKLKLKTN